MAKKQPRERKYITCEKCGNVMPADALICDECGADLSKQEPAEKTLTKVTVSDNTLTRAEAKAAAKAAAERRKAAREAREAEKARLAAEGIVEEPLVNPFAREGEEDANAKESRKPDFSLKTNRRLQEILICIIVAIILIFIIDYRYRVEMPDLEGLEAVDACNHLTELGLKTENLHVKTEDGTEVADPSDGLFIVLSQDIAPGRKIRKNKVVTMICEDRESTIEAILKDAYYAHPAAIIAKLKELYYSVEILDSAGYDYSDHWNSYNDDQKDLLYIIKIGELDRKNNSVDLYVDNEFNIEVAVEDALAGLEGKTVSSAVKAAKNKHYAYVITAADGSDYTATYDTLSDDDKKDKIITSIDFDHDNRKILIGFKSKKEEAEKEAEQALVNEIGAKIPYVGLEEKYIDSTLMGKHAKYDSSTGIYEWVSDDGKYPVLTVTCKDGKVASVDRKFTDVYWLDENVPDTSIDKDAYDAEIASQVQPRRPH